MHCDEAPCIKAAGDGAIYKRKDGIVVIDPAKARGQQKLVNACPYNEIWWNEKQGLPQKCTFCAHLIDDGWGKSRCVQACPTGALSIVNVTEPEMKRIITAERLETYKPDLKTMPRVYYKNLYKFTRSFIGGSVAVKVNGLEDCAEGAKVTLFSAQGKQVGQALTDNFGDFKFDGLPDESCAYALQIEFREYPLKRMEVQLDGSTYTGVIYL
jgi:ferredoxin